jgi:hypothetical protein
MFIIKASIIKFGKFGSGWVPGNAVHELKCFTPLNHIASTLFNIKASIITTLMATTLQTSLQELLMKQMKAHLSNDSRR